MRFHFHLFSIFLLFLIPALSNGPLKRDHKKIRKLSLSPTRIRLIAAIYYNRECKKMELLRIKETRWATPCRHQKVKNSRKPSNKFRRKKRRSKWRHDRFAPQDPNYFHDSLLNNVKDEETSENSDRSDLFNYLKNVRGDDLLRALKSNWRRRSLQGKRISDQNLYAEANEDETSFQRGSQVLEQECVKRKGENVSSTKRPEYDLRKDEKDLWYGYHPAFGKNVPVDGHLDTESSLLGRLGKGSSKSNATANATVIADNINERIDKEIIPALTQISKQLDELKDNKTKSNKEGLPCPLDGCWSSTLDMKLNITTLKNLSLTVNLTSINSSKANNVIDKTWKIEGLTMAKLGGPFILVALNRDRKKVASFIGQCKKCNQTETIYGTWTFGGYSLDCSNVSMAVQIKQDTLLKENVTTIQIQKGKIREMEEIPDLKRRRKRQQQTSSRS